MFSSMDTRVVRSAGTTIMVRRCDGMPSRSARPGRIVAPNPLVTARFTRAMAASTDGTSPRSARSARRMPFTPHECNAINGQGKHDAGNQDDGGNVVAGHAGAEVAQRNSKGRSDSRRSLRRRAGRRRSGGNPDHAGGPRYRMPSPAAAVPPADKAARAMSISRLLRAARQLLNRATVQVAAREIHCRKVAIRPQQFVDEADALEELGPVHIREQPHAGDDVANGYVRCALALMLFVDHLVSCRSLPGQVIVQPSSCRRYRGILIAQPQHQLDGKGWRQRGAGRIPADQRVRLRRISVQTQQPVGHIVRVLACSPAADDARGSAAQVLDQHDAQRDGNRPKLPDGQRLNVLIGAYEKTQRVGIESAVAVGDVAPKPVRTRGDSRRTDRLRASAIGGRNQAADLRESRGSALRPDDNCPAAIRRRA